MLTVLKVQKVSVKPLPKLTPLAAYENSKAKSRD